MASTQTAATLSPATVRQLQTEYESIKKKYFSPSLQKHVYDIDDKMELYATILHELKYAGLSYILKNPFPRKEDNLKRFESIIEDEISTLLKAKKKEAFQIDLREYGGGLSDKKTQMGQQFVEYVEGFTHLKFNDIVGSADRQEDVFGEVLPFGSHPRFMGGKVNAVRLDSINMPEMAIFGISEGDMGTVYLVDLKNKAISQVGYAGK
jgi:hypothetical protein